MHRKQNNKEININDITCESASVSGTSVYNTYLMEHLCYKGHIDIAAVFAKENGISFSPTFKQCIQNKIRKLIEIGDIKSAKRELNDYNVEIIDNDSDLRYFIEQHIIYENANSLTKDNSKEYESGIRGIIKDIQEILIEMIEEKDALSNELEDLLEFVVFNSNSTTIYDRRKKLADIINQKIIEAGAHKDDKITSTVEKIITDEACLAKNHKFKRFMDMVLE